MAYSKLLSKEQISEIRKQNYRKNIEKNRAFYRERYRAKREQILTKMRNNYNNDPKYRKNRLTINRKYQKTPEGRQKKRVLENTKLHIYRNKVFEILGGYICKQCGYSADKRALQLDHIKGGGNKQRKKGYTYLTWKHYADNPELTKSELQPLCANCNSIKKFTNKEFCS